MKITFAHPPLDDPTLPYHSTAYLAGHLAQNGFEDVAIRDVNIEFVNWCLERETVASLYDVVERRLRGLEAKSSLSFQEQEEYYALWVQDPIELGRLHRAVSGLRQWEEFLDWNSYRENVNTVLRYFSFLGGLSYPAEIANFHHVSRGRFSFYNLKDLFNPELAVQTCALFARFLEERLVHDAELRATDCLGISIVYDHQIFHALHLARWFKRTWPGKKVLLGGTAVSQLYKYLKVKDHMRHFFDLCDGIVVGEGETAICQIADRGGDIEPGMKVQNLITCDRATGRVYLPDHVHYENVPALGRPLYDYPWDLYLAPARGINYSPTRGCYWNKCTFCDYGLNTARPTSPWRERRTEQVVDDLRSAITETAARYVYFAVDVMSPAYLDRLSDAIGEAGLDIRWSAELRMEKVFSTERCRKMAESGCVCVSFGMESGSQRILDLIDKGTKVEHMGETMKNFAEAGIAVQLMAFSDFPTETREEKEETLRFVEEHNDHWSVGGMGTFLLTGTAIVAKNPEKFGIRLLDTQDADIARAVAFELNEETEAALQSERTLLTEDHDASFDSGGGIFPPVLGRPWAGGTDTLHTMIYYQRYGRRFFRESPPFSAPVLGPEAELLSSSISLQGVVKPSFFDVSQIIANRQSLSRQLCKLAKVPQEPTAREFEVWAATVDRLAASGSSYWAMAADKCLRLDKLVFRLLQLGGRHGLSVGDLVKSFDPTLRERILQFFLELGRRGLVEFNPSARGSSELERQAA